MIELDTTVESLPADDEDPTISMISREREGERNDPTV